MSLNHLISNVDIDANFNSLKIQGVTVTPGAGGGNVSSTQAGTADGELVVYSGTSGTLIKKSGIVQSLSTLILDNNDLTDTGKLLPKFTDSKDIGSNTSNLRYKDIHISGDVYKNGVPISGGGGGGSSPIVPFVPPSFSMTNFTYSDLYASYQLNGKFLTVRLNFLAAIQDFTIKFWSFQLEHPAALGNIKQTLPYRYFNATGQETANGGISWGCQNGAPILPGRGFFFFMTTNDNPTGGRSSRIMAEYIVELE